MITNNLTSRGLDEDDKWNDNGYGEDPSIEYDEDSGDDTESDMYCEGCQGFFSSDFQDNEAYCPLCGSTEITEAS